VSSSTLDNLLARSRSPGKFVERRSFTLSREKAIEKQREFALRHPKQYLLELVQSAVFAGATYLAIDTRPQSLLVAWVGGTPLVDRELESLFDYLFADRGDARWRHLVQLAIGVNALLQRSPRMLRIESGDGKRAFRMDLEPSGRATIGQPTEHINGTYLYAEHNLGWFARFRSQGPTDEQLLVEERCLYTPVPILLNGVAPFGYRGSRHIAVFGAKAWEPFDQDGRRGVVALHTSTEGPRGFRMVVGGVWISTLPLDVLATKPLYGVICDDGLRKTADQSDIVQDHRFFEMLHAVQPVATRLMYLVAGPSYRPPPLPPIPRVETAPAPETGEHAAEPPTEEVVLEPLPTPIPTLRPRYPVTLEQLAASLEQRAEASGRAAQAQALAQGIPVLPGRRQDLPIFYVTPTAAPSFAVPSTAPDRFPWTVLVLTEGKAATLASTLPSINLHKLSAVADVDFVRRVLDQRSRTRDVTVTVPDGQLTLRLHLEGPLPDWGPGVPFCVVGPHGVLEFGGIVGHQVEVRGGSRRATLKPRGLEVALALPRVSLVIETSGGGLSEHHVRAALDTAHRLALPVEGPPDTGLLGALLGALAVPQFVQPPAEGGKPEAVTLEVALPPGWPASVAQVPLAHSRAGPLTLQVLLGLLGTNQTFALDDLPALLSLDALEQRLGYGHLTHRELEGQPVFGAGRFGGRWVWLETQEMWSSTALQQVVWVAATLSGPRGAERAEFPGSDLLSPALGAASLGGGRQAQPADPASYAEGFTTLFHGLQRLEADRRWGVAARGPITAGRAEGMGRLAMIELAEWLKAYDTPLLVPSDGGGRRSLREIREHRAARAVARRGVRLAEPWTFALSRDELDAVRAGTQRPALRYDDSPSVWPALPETDRGWLLRQEIQHKGLRGWVGLRVPYDATTGVLLRTTGKLIGMSDLERMVPCHGLLWSEDGAPEITAEQRRVAQLAALRLYQELVSHIDEPRTFELGEAARRYAQLFAVRSWQRTGQLSGTALELARRIKVGEVTLEKWLALPPPERPAAPGLERLDTELEMELETSQQGNPEEGRLDERPSDSSQAYRLLVERLLDALDRPPIAIYLVPDPDGGRDRLTSVLVDSVPTRVVIGLDESSPVVSQALAGPGCERELLLIHLARHLCTWGASAGHRFDLLRAQQVLLAQRLGA
jgi:hypothetical protein